MLNWLTVSEQSNLMNNKIVLVSGLHNTPTDLMTHNATDLVLGSEMCGCRHLGFLIHRFESTSAGISQCPCPQPQQSHVFCEQKLRFLVTVKWKRNKTKHSSENHYLQLAFITYVQFMTSEKACSCPYHSQLNASWRPRLSTDAQKACESIRRCVSTSLTWIPYTNLLSSK